MSVGPRYGATCLRPGAVNWEEGLEPDERDPRILGEGPCNLIHEAKAKYDQNQFGVWLTCRTCAARLHYAPKKGAPQNTITMGPIPEVVRAVITELGNLPVERIDSNRFRGLIKIEQGRRQAARMAATAKASPGTPLKAKSKAPAKARSSKAPEYDLSSEAPEEDSGIRILDRWNILLRRLFRNQLEIKEMTDL